MGEQVRLLFEAELSEVLDQRMIEVRLDLLFEVVGALKVDLPAQLDRDAQAESKLDRKCGFFSRSNRPRKQR